MKLSNINKTYHNKLDDVEVFKNMSVEIPEQGLVLIYGASGSGKTTLFNILAGLDNDFTGEITKVERVEYLSQGIELYENLSVFENLKLVKNDSIMINNLLSKFEMYTLKDKKIKKLSNGEKRRIQIIRSSLINPSLFICDEPTASLDDENAKLVCELLKEMSREMTVLIATHDCSLFESYADCIFKINNLNIDKVNEHQIISMAKKRQTNHNRNIKDYIYSSFMNIMAHKTNMFVTIIFLLLMIWAGYSTIYYNLSSNKDYNKNIWYYSSNLIEGLPTKFELDPVENKCRWYENYDLYDQKIVKQLKSEGITGYSLIFDLNSFNRSTGNYIENNNFEEMAKAATFPYISEVFPFEQGKDEYGNILFGYNLPNSPFVLIKESKFKDVEETMLHRIFVYEIFDFDDIQIKYGNIPKNNNEIVIGKDLAETLQRNLGLASNEELVGKMITLDTLPDMGIVSGPKDLQVKITGISSLDNLFEDRIYFKEGAYSSLLADLYHYDINQAKFHSLKLLIDPNENMERVIENVNRNISSKYNQFTIFNGTTNGFAKEFQEINQNTTIVSVCSIVIICVSLIGLLFMKYFYRKQIKKEYGILRKYKYSIMKNEFISCLIVCSVLMIIVVASFPAVITLFNQVSMRYFNKNLYSINYTIMILDCLFVFVVYSLIMMMSSYFITRKK